MRTPREIAEDVRKENWHYASASEIKSLAAAFLELLDERMAPRPQPEFEWLVQHVRCIARRVSGLETRADSQAAEAGQAKKSLDALVEELQKIDQKVWEVDARVFTLVNPNDKTSPDPPAVGREEEWEEAWVAGWAGAGKSEVRGGRLGRLYRWRRVEK